VRRFTSVKVGVLLFFLLLLAFFGLTGNDADTQPQQADAGNDPSATTQAGDQQAAAGQQATAQQAAGQQANGQQVAGQQTQGQQAGAPSGGNQPAQATSGEAGARSGTHTESVTFQVAGHGTQGKGAAGQGTASNQSAQTLPEDPSGNGMIDIQGLGAGGTQQGSSAGNGAGSTGAPAGKAASGAQATSGMAGPGMADAGAGAPGGESVLHDDDVAPQPATGDSMIELPGAPSFAITQDASGAIRLTGGVPDDATRNQWMNAIRLGARDVSVNGNLRLQRVDPHAAARWEPQLTALVALMRERNLAELRVRGDVVELVDTTGNPAQARESVNLIRAQVPDGYRVALAGDARGQADTRNARGSAAQADARNARNGVSQADARNARNGTTQAAAGTAASDDEPRKTHTQLRAEAKNAAAGKRAGAKKTVAEKRAEAKKTAAEKRADARRAAASGKTADDSSASARNSSSKDTASAKRLAAREDAAGRSSSKTAAAGNCKSVSALSAPVYFSSNTATLTAAERRRLRNLGACLGKTAWVRVTGHADPRDSAAANQSLSERRARAVAGAIAAGGFSSARITVVGAGQTKSRAAKSKAAQQRARRVDIRVG
jgi:strain CBS138 chromosome J complete sequence